MTYLNLQRDRTLPFAVDYFADLFTYRHLCWNLVGSDLRARFRRSRLGILWAVIQPLMFSLIIAAVWGTVFGSGNYWNYAIYVFSGMIVWEYFSTNIVVAQDALINAEGYLKQTRVPFLIFQVRTPLTGMVILLCGIIGLVVMMTVLGLWRPLGLHLLLVPVFLVILLLFATPIATIMSIVGTQFRDVKHISYIAVQALFFVSPVMLERSVLERPELGFLEFANPMMPIIDMFRAPLLDGRLWQPSALGAVLAWTAGLWIVAVLLQARFGRRLVFAL